MPDSEPPRIIDYEGSSYRTDFWEGQQRDYEDRVERVALRQLLPAHGKRLLEIGAGFGRLTNEYSAFERVVLLDYSLSHLQDAQSRLGESDRYMYVAADVYKMPFLPGVFDAVTMIRVLHHMAEVPAAFAQVRQVMTAGGTFILEFANKRNAKAVLRYLLRRQSWSPFTPEPVEFVELNFDFHPDYVQTKLLGAGFEVQKRIPVSFFRLNLLKRLISTGMLVGADQLLQRSGLLYSPSVFVRSVAEGDSQDNLTAEDILVCPVSGGALAQDGDTLYCAESGLRYAIRDGIYDFKAPIDEA